MKSFEVYTYRRIALRWSREMVAEKAGVQPNYVEWFESGKRIGRDFEDKIKGAINEGFRELDPIEHYKVRILELAYEIRFDEDVRETIYRSSHMMVELGKLQRALLDGVTIQEDWEV